MASEETTSVLVIDDNPIRASIIEEGLRAAGCMRVRLATDMHGIAATIEALQPDVIVIDLGNPNRDMLENAFQLSRAVKKPIAMFVDHSDAAATAAAIEAGVSAYVVDGLKPQRIKPILEMAVGRFNAFAKMERELQMARDALSERKLVERAKAILMRQRNIDEERAYRIMRSAAMNQNRRLAEIAESLITAASLLDDEK
ncbi:ANTAR domain-containing response regulator [Notoacmeibacter marinus]|uniref:ANTAR domain-containing response regulator n=1 Tax=Notoacmeibacter marinus TaxID=1876515 RepID=UPI000DF2F951|nr:ANTAR domain-containing protein [Notoacmeibacter marinus]